MKGQFQGSKKAARRREWELRRKLKDVREKANMDLGEANNIEEAARIMGVKLNP